MIGQKIKAYRRFIGKSQEEVAFDLELTTNSYWKIENGATDPSWGRVSQIVNYFGFETVFDFLKHFEKCSHEPFTAKVTEKI